MLHVDRVEADDGRVEADVGFGDVGSEVVGCGVLCEVGFGAGEGGEERVDGLFVGFLCAKEGFFLAGRGLGIGGRGGLRGEAGFVDSVVYVVVGPVVRSFDFCLKVRGEQV